MIELAKVCMPHGHFCSKIGACLAMSMIRFPVSESIQNLRVSTSWGVGDTTETPILCCESMLEKSILIFEEIHQENIDAFLT